jgi:hypothetical protein
VRSTISRPVAYVAASLTRSEAQEIRDMVTSPEHRPRRDRRARHPTRGGEADLVAVHVAIEGGTNGFDPAANVEQLIGPTRGCQTGEPIGERLERPIEHRLGRCPLVTRRAVLALSLFFDVIHQLSSL